MASWKRGRILLLRKTPGLWLFLVFSLAACGSAVIAPGTTAETELDTAVSLATPLEAPVMRYETMTMAEGTAVRYAIVLPAGFTPEQPYPTLLALPPGGQTQAMVEAGLSYWQAEAQNRGWVVVSPVAPDGVLFFQGSETLLPEFMDRIMETVAVENGRFHLAGISNGGRSAFRIAIAEPERFQSLLVAPGFPPTDDDFAQLDKLANLPIAMFVGENDAPWVTQMQAAANELRRLGARISLEIVPGEGHVIQSLRDGVHLFDFFDAHR